MLKVGKLYSCPEYSLFLYPDKDTAAAAGPAVPSAGAAEAAYWSRKLGKPVICTEKNIPLLVLNNEGKYVEVLAGDRKGWIINEDWLELKEISCP